MNLPTAHRIRLALENAIVDGRFAPGARIDPEALAAEYGCSRTPVREALQALEASGLLIVQPKRGTFVAQLGIPELLDRFEVMAQLESFCARLACRRADAADLARIAEALEACEAARHDPDGYYARNTQFHQAIYRAARNPFLEAETLRLQAVLQPYRRRQLQAAGRVANSQAEHRRIARAIAAGEAEAAARAMTEHVLVQGERFRDLVAVVDRLSRPPSPPAARA